ncbi:antitoxin Xre/MbcA/ParS toxin-binding domain-containing protein [Pseudomonas veronii]|uniref:antitoxin Xre/MbcA/ParS toxin-binding domain-containing protein n=1 Tax=Pseudomonas veronii TaxID=76761 RepID=UPI002D767DEB|nr:antitoxin Xre/MbcA/ParS toxin-binding domain-containing protein [Pseudomonas veronii]WRU62671.1 antitoxin Xre/MbcA/ParS toxin-binding domain-containing protein [Pseudomonas veronii]
MSSRPKPTAHRTSAAYKPTECLFSNSSDQISPLAIYKIIEKGFALKEVQLMVSPTKLYTSALILEKIIGGSLRGYQRALKRNARLSSKKSAVVFQYAKGLELAITVFGSLDLAEQWLGRPCKYLEGITPVDALDNYFGYKAVEDYLKKILYGIYQ